MDYGVLAPHSKIIKKELVSGDSFVAFISLHSFKSIYFIRIVEVKGGRGKLEQNFLEAKSLEEAKDIFERKVLEFRLKSA